MALYLGSEPVKLTQGSKVEIETPAVRQIIEGTISEYSNSRISTVGSYAFACCYNLTSVNLPQATSIGKSAFFNCYSLTSVSLPQATLIGGYAFGYCSSLTSVSLSQATTIRNHAFDYCTHLTSIDLPKATEIGSNAFADCYKLLSIYLIGSSVVSLESTNTFKSTPISDYTTSTAGIYGSIYVPASLYNNYITAMNWSIYSARIVSI